MTRIVLRIELWMLIGCGLFIACGPSEQEMWRRATLSWEVREPSAHGLWSEMPQRGPLGARAHRLLAEAEVQYQHGLRQLRLGDEDAAQVRFRAGARLAPINPVHYFTLAAICEEQELDLAEAKYLSRYLAAAPQGAHAQHAQRRLDELQSGLGGVFDNAPADRRSETSGAFASSVPEMVLGVSGLLALLVAVLIVVNRRGPGVSLARLITGHPELQGAITYLVGSLRHELLKHRIGAVADVLSGMGALASEDDRRVFLLERLYGKISVKNAWDAHLGAFVAAVGYRFDHRKDPHFRQAAAAFATIAALESSLRGGSRRAARRLRGAHEQLITFDGYLAEQLAALSRATVDGPLLQAVVDEVRAEYHVAAMQLDEISFIAPLERIEVEVPRMDLVLILKNVVRNGARAAAASEQKRVQFRAYVELEPTGEESVLLAVADTGPSAFSRSDIEVASPVAGLGLVRSAVRRYGGSIDVRAGTDGFTKEVVVRFFRAWRNGDSP